MKPSVLAVCAHPDDIEFMMAGTFILLRDAGWSLHYLNIANGSCGTATATIDEIVRQRREEARDAAQSVGATYHESLCNDLEVYHTTDLVAKVASVVRQVRPRILLTLSPQDYMEDHMNACRIAVTAAFARGMRNFSVVPPVAPIEDDVTLYHALPHGLHGPLREPIRAGLYVDIGSVLPTKRRMLACHRSQKEWLDKSQGMDVYLDTMEGFARTVGQWSGRFEFAEGWRRRNHLGFSQHDTDPLSEALAGRCLIDPAYEQSRL